MKPRLITLCALCAAAALAAASASAWKTDPTQSRVVFIGTQAGAKFQGVFERFTADIVFDPNALAASKIDVTIDVKSVNTKDKERDLAILGAELFAADRWPTAHYVVEKVTQSGAGKFTAQGKLTIRDVTRDVPVQFTHQADATGVWLKGKATIKRLDFGVGQGEWRDTKFVRNDVRVEFALRLSR